LILNHSVPTTALWQKSLQHGNERVIEIENLPGLKALNRRIANLKSRRD